MAFYGLLPRIGYTFGLYLNRMLFYQTPGLIIFYNPVKNPGGRLILIRYHIYWYRHCAHHIGALKERLWQIYSCNALIL